MFFTWMAVASMFFQLGLIIVLVLCCLLINIFVKELAPRFSSTSRNRFIALAGGMAFAIFSLVLSFQQLKGLPFTEATLIATIIGFFGKLAVTAFIIYFLLERFMNRK